MGVGKTTVGRALAQREGVPFFDLDDVIERRAGRSVASLFAEEGEAAFRALEARVLLEVLETPSPSVVSVGGGALLDPASRRAALERAKVVTLTASPSTIEERTAGSARPLLASASDRPARVRELLAARAPAYAEAHAVLPTDGRTLDEVVTSVRRAWSELGLVLPLGLRSYPVRFTDAPGSVVADIVTALRASQLFVVTDDNVGPLWGASLDEALRSRGVSASSIVLPSGEQNKRLAAVESALSSMVAGGADRSSVVVALGGGVVSDVAGFAAATLFRGVRWVVVPTSLLAMVDAAIGGKTGVDLGAAKNAVGAFHQPSAVVVSLSHVRTESDRGFRSGLAEVVKSACVGDPALFELLERAPTAALSRDTGVLHEIVLRAAAVKVRVVSRDEAESGERAFLNFGHTLGHALEAHGGYQRRTHGEAVSLGMVAMAKVGLALGITSPETSARLTGLLEQLGLPVDLRGEPVTEALSLLSLDKKRRGSAIRIVLLRAIGEPLLHDLPLDELSRLLESAASSA